MTKYIGLLARWNSGASFAYGVVRDDNEDPSFSPSFVEGVDPNGVFSTVSVERVVKEF